MKQGWEALKPNGRKVHRHPGRTAVQTTAQAAEKN